MSPSSALIDDGEKTTVRSGNAKLHNMQKVEAEHIAYAFIQWQARYGISSRDKWSESDGKYSYHDAYYHTIKAIREAPDPDWAKSLLEWWNNAVFTNKKGVLDFNLSENEDEEDDYALMKKQFAMRTIKGWAETNKTPLELDSETSMMDATTTTSTSRREPSSPATTPPPEDLIVSPAARPIPRPHPIKPTTQHASSSSGAHVPPAPTPSPARVSAPTNHSPKPASVATVPHTVVSKKRPSAELLVDSDSPLTDAESEVAPSPAKHPKQGKRAKAGESNKSAGKKRKGRK
ncbi:uncharacterized protein F5147DRAFT_772028 [Suillus discolor]|uniref:Uncharacterized protein n=1 Tax=Suillus discolor TaxID=1912936 RepID=A0A9P7F9F3_9AGAM|nr:uncharacterized protein F5147DRAFT_772028 [Suillus discolor]KAG2111307.1 hypothetical protein F5147DRAFT_772028 [Suillus discolor]